MSISYWWAGNGVSQTTVSLTPQEAELLVAALAPQNAVPAGGVGGLREFAEGFKFSVCKDSFYQDAYLSITRPDKSITFRLGNGSQLSAEIADLEKRRLSALDAPVPGDGVGVAGDSCRHGRWNCTDCDKGWDAALAPQNAEDILTHDSGVTDELRGLRPAPADDAAVAWRIRVREGGAVYHIYTERLPFEPDADSPVVAISDPVPVYLRPAKAVDVEAVRDVRWLVSSARAFLRHFNPCNLAEDKSQQWQSLSHQCDVVERALLRDSNASSDKGGR